MAQVQDPLKQFQFGIIAAGLDPYLVQECNLPDFELDVVTHGDVNYDVKTAGRAKVGTVTMTNLRSASRNRNWLNVWLLSIQNIALGGGLPPTGYKRVFNVVQYSFDNFTITDDWLLEGVWPSKINGQEFRRTASDNSIDTIEFQVDRIIKVR